MTKRSGDHKLQKERRKQALNARQADPQHTPSQTCIPGGRWKKNGGREGGRS